MTAKAAPKRKPAPVCKVAGCAARRVYTRGLCALHWCCRADLADPVVAS